jgi:glycoside/pentoside/hexuronide:cation symporter, GPH family
LTRPLKLPTILLFTYAIGQFGWALQVEIINALLIYYYQPPKVAMLPTLLPEVQYFGFLSLFTVLLVLGKVYEAAINPVVAGISDAWKGTWGRRIPFMAIGMIPCALGCALLFMPPDAGATTINLVWFMGFNLLYLTGLTLYVNPHNALMIELGHNEKERLTISIAISVTYALGVLGATFAPVIWEVLQANFNLPKVNAVQMAIVLLCIASVVFMALPVFTIREKLYSTSTGPSGEKILQSLRATMGNRRFRTFLFSDLAYWIGSTIVVSGLMYYITVLLQLPEAALPQMMAVLFVVSFLFYPVVNFLSTRGVSRKMMIQSCFLVFAVLFSFIYSLGGQIPLDPYAQGYIVMILAAVPMATLGILPNTILADISELDSLQNGVNRQGMYFAVRSIGIRVGYIIGVLIFLLLLQQGKDVGDDYGIRLTGLAGVVVNILAFLLFLRYDERDVMKEIYRLRPAIPTKDESA